VYRRDREASGYVADMKKQQPMKDRRIKRNGRKNNREV
jgi:hypothetical protein